MKRCLVFVLLAMVVCVRADVLESSGVKGGLVICIGADAAEQVSNHWKNPQFLFQCLETLHAVHVFYGTLKKAGQKVDLKGSLKAAIKI